VLDCRDWHEYPTPPAVVFTLSLDYAAGTVTYLPSGTSRPITVNDKEITWPGTRQGELNTLNRYTLQLNEYRPSGVPRNWLYICTPGGRRI